jgi:glycosyltransferase involved in cell wall biosynthesis
LGSRITDFRPDVVISANTPLDAQVRAAVSSGRVGAAFIFWVQDLHSVAIARILKRRLPFLGRLIGNRYEALERRILDASDAVVAITPDFLPTLTSWGVPADRITVIENWASLTDVRPAAKVNSWSKAHGLGHQAVFLYAGTLGRKHDPSLLVGLADAVPEATVVVIAEGAGANWLARRAHEVQNLVLLPLQPPDTISEVLASADVLVALLEPDAGAFSVPSKVLSYLSAGRPILGSMPLDNLAARTIIGAGAGRVAAAGDTPSFLAAARDLLSDEDAREAAGSAGRAYALAKFDIQSIADRFEAIIRRCTADTSEPLRMEGRASRL